MRRLGIVLCVVFLTLGCQPVEQPVQSPVTTATPTTLTLVGTSWIAEDIAGRAILDQVQSTLTFESAERIVGSTGCNRYFAPLQVSGTTLRVGMGGSTRRACPPAVMDQESQFLAALEATRAYRRDGGTLWLLDESGRVLVRLKQTDTAAGRQEPAVPPPPASGLQAGTLAAYAFDCSGGPGFVMTQVDSETINLALPDGVRRLTRERTASGAKYSNGQVTVWNKGQEASLVISSHTYTCVENRAQSIREDARRRGVEFRGTGNEPGWVLEVLPDRIAFMGDYGSEHVMVPRPAAVVDAVHAATVYTAVTEVHRLQVRIEERACLDSMSGERFAASVAVELDDQHYQGCGDALR